MRAPLSWLRDFAPIEGTVDDLASALSNLGLVVDGVEQVGAGLDGIVVARVLALRSHPTADKIQLVDVDPGTGETRQIVCGAFNMTVGDLVPLATLGAVMPDGTTIGRRRMRGEWSDGMLCSAAELGLPEVDGSHGILILPPAVAPPGTALKAALGLEADVVFDLDISPNRPDALSVAGVARDLAAALHVGFTLPAVASPGDGGVEPALVSVADPDLAPRVSGTVLTGVAIGPSPAWMVRRLSLAGMRAINNVVDVSNYVMLELGQPTHAYDLDRLGGRGLHVRRARAGESLVTLDGVTRTLTGDDCLICDAESVPVGIAGIMGGASSEISAGTTAVLVEAAYFTSLAIARTGKRLGLHSEARSRFERGADPEILDLAVDRLASLLPGVARGATTDVRSAEHLPGPRTVLVRTARVNDLLGTSLTDADVAGLLAPIGFRAAPAGEGGAGVAGGGAGGAGGQAGGAGGAGRVRSGEGGSGGGEATGGVQMVTIPSWRPDSDREIDVVEEVARLYGYRRIERTLPPGIRTGGGLTPYQRSRRRVRDILAGTGLSEAWTTTFLAPGDLERAGLPGQAVEVENPLDRSESLLRTSLLPGLLKAVRFNVDRQQTDVRLFEIGHVFAPPTGDAVVPVEREDLAAIVSGDGARDGGGGPTAARLWKVLATALRLADARIEAAERPGFHPTRAAQILVSGQPIGALGEIDPTVSSAYGLAGREGFLTLSLEALLTAPRRPAVARPVSRYPAGDIDLAFVVDDEVAAATVQTTIEQAAGDLLEWAQLFDVYRGPQLGAGRRSLAYHLRLRALDRTLTDAEVAGIRGQAIERVAAAHGGELRA